MNKLIAMIMGQNCEKFISMCLDSVKDADEIIYCDGGSTDMTLEIVKLDHWKEPSRKDINIIENTWDPKDKQMNGKQRNFYLKYLKEYHPNDWCICLDADEVCEDINKIKKFIGSIDDDPIYNTTLGALSIKMRHFIGDLGHEDATRAIHWVPNRLFRINRAIGYPEHSHPILNTEGDIRQTNCTTIWHLGHLPVDYMRYIMIRTKQHKEDSLIHDQEFLNWWGQAHLFGKYPTREVNPREIPKIIYEGLGMDFEEVYSSQEQIQLKHAIMVKQWNDYFKPADVLDLGCGRGCYLYFWRWFNVGIGIEINKWAVDNAFIPFIKRGDCSDEKNYSEGHCDLITAIDLLEHLDNEKLNRTLELISKYGNDFLFSIPFIGDPNLETDKTHKQFKTKEEWIKLIESHGIKIKETPNDWLFRDQILVGEK